MSTRGELTARVVELVASARVNATGWWRVNCPACAQRAGTRDASRALGVNSESGKFKCFRCGFGGILPGYSTEPDWSPQERAVDASVGELEAARIVPTDPAFSVPVEYLRGRGVSDVAVDECKISYGGISGRMAGRVVVPVLVAGEMVGWVARDITGRASRRYTNMPGGWASTCVFNQDALYENLPTPVLVVEGVFDALPYYPDAVALFGMPSDQQVALLGSCSRPLAIALDGDARRQATALALRLLMYGKEAPVVRLPALTDPGSVSRPVMQHLLRRATAC